MNKHKILVIGSNGQVALCLKEIALSTWKFIGRPDFDVCNQEIVNKVISVEKPSLIINTAAYTAVDKAEYQVEEAYKLNSLAAKNLALACQMHNIPLIQLSTDYVFDGPRCTVRNGTNSKLSPNIST